MSFNGMNNIRNSWWQGVTGSSWEEWYAWHPVTDIHGERHWLKKIYRKYNWAKSTEQPFGKEYDYGTIFDVLAANQNSDDHYATVNPVPGSMYFDHNTNEVKVYDGANWFPVSDGVHNIYAKNSYSQTTMGTTSQSSYTTTSTGTGDDPSN